MELLGVNIGRFDDAGNDWYRMLANWFHEPIWDLFDLSEEHHDILKEFQNIANRAGCTNSQQVEYIHKLERRIDDMDKVLTSLCNQNP